MGLEDRELHLWTPDRLPEKLIRSIVFSLHAVKHPDADDVTPFIAAQAKAHLEKISISPLVVERISLFNTMSEDKFNSIYGAMRKKVDEARKL